MDVTLMTPISNESMRADWVEIHTAVGNFVLQEDHAPMILSLKAQEPLVVGLQEGTERSFVLKNGGIIYINRKEVTVLIDDVP